MSFTSLSILKIIVIVKSHNKNYLQEDPKNVFLDKPLRWVRIH
jgi:hypothetical protein